MTIYYVDNSSPNASDCNSGTSMDAPLATLAAVERLTLLPGDTVAFKAGTTYSSATDLSQATGVTISTNSGVSGLQSVSGVAVGSLTNQAVTNLAINPAAPQITSVSIAPGVLKIGSVVTATVAVTADPNALSLVSGTIDGFPVTNLTKVAEGVYSVQFTVTSGGSDVAAGAAISSSLQFKDSAGQVSNLFSGSVTEASTPQSTQAPNLISATMLGSSQIELNYDQSLIPGQGVSPSAFSVSVNGTPMQVTNVYVNPAAINGAAQTAIVSLSDAALNITASGTASNPITFTSYGIGAAPVISNSSSGYGYADAIDLSGASYVVINGLAIGSAQQAGININAASHNITVENTNITNVGEGLLVNGYDNLITQNTIHDLHMVKNTPTNTTNAATIAATNNDDYGANGVVIGGNNNTLTYNTIINAIAASYDYGTDGGAFELYGSPTNDTISNNYAANSEGFIESGGYQGNISNIFITDNLSVNNGQFAAIHNNGGGFGGTYSNFNMTYNTIINTTTAASTGPLVILDGSAPTSSVNFSNNIVSINAGDSVFKRVGPYHTNNTFYLYSKATHLFNNWSSVLLSGESFGQTIYQNTPLANLPAVLGAISPTEGANLSALPGASASSPSSSTPVITSVTVSNVPLNIGGIGTATITVAPNSDLYSLVTGSVGGIALQNLTQINSTTYTAQFAVSENSTDRLAANGLAVVLVLESLEGTQNTPYTATIVQSNDSIDAHRPVAVNSTITGNVLAIVFNQSLDPLNLPSANNFSVMVAGSLTSVMSIAVDPNGTTLDLTLARTATQGQTASLIYTAPASLSNTVAIRDVDGNDARSFLLQSISNTTVTPGYTPNTTVTIDANPPILVGGTANGSVLTLVYNDTLDALPIQLPAPSDYSVTSNGNTIAVSSASVQGSNVTLILASPVVEQQSVSVAYQSPGTGATAMPLYDSHGNLAPTSTARSLVNVTPPTPLSITIPNVPVTFGNVVTATISVLPCTDIYSLVSGSIDGFALSNLQKINNTTYTAQFTPSEGGVDQPAGSAIPVSLVLQDSAGNVNPIYTAPITESNAVIDVNRPAIVQAGVNGASLVLGYSKALNPADMPSPLDFAVTADGVPNLVIGMSIDQSGQILTLNLALPVTNFQAVTVAYNAPTAGSGDTPLQDLYGLTANSVAPQQVVNVTPELPPLVTAVSMSGSVLGIGSQGTMTISVAASPDTYTLASGQMDGFALSNLQKINNTTYTAQFTPSAGGTSQPVGSAIPVNFVLQDSSGNQTSYATPITQSGAAIDVTTPLLQSASVNGDTLIITYSKAIDPTIPLTLSDFAVTADGSPITIISQLVNAVTQTVTLGLGSAIANGQSVALSYTDPGAGNGDVQDLTGNHAASVVAQSVTNVTPQQAPSILAVSIPNVPLSIGSLATVTISVAASTDIYTLASGEVDGFALSNLQKVNNTTYTAQFTAAEGGTDVAALAGIPLSLVMANSAGGISPAFVTSIMQSNDSIDVNRPQFSSAFINGALLVLKYNEALDGLNPPPASAFAVTAGGQTVAVSAVIVNTLTQTVTLTLSSPVSYGQSVAVSYSDPTSGNDVAAIQDLADNDAATLSSQAVSNLTPEPPPSIISVSIPGVALKIGSVATATITVVAQPDAYTLISGTIDGFTVSNLQKINNSTYTVQFTALEGGTDVSAGAMLPYAITLQDAAGDQTFPGLTAFAQSANTGLVGLMSAPIDVNRPLFKSATVNGTTLVMSYGEALDALDPPPLSAFAVTAAGLSVGVKSVLVNALAQTVTLTLSAPVIIGQAVTVSYTDPTVGDDALAIQDVVGNDAATLVSQAVVNTTPNIVLKSTTRLYTNGVVGILTNIMSDGSTIVDTFDMTGFENTETITHKDGSVDSVAYGIKNQPYTTQDFHYNASGKLFELDRYTSNGVLLYQQITGADGTVTTDTFDTTGKKISEGIVLGNKTGFYVSSYVNYAVPNQAYTTEFTYYDGTGKMVEDDRYLANGTLVYKDVITPTSSTLDRYDNNGTQTVHDITRPGGLSDYYTYVIAGSPGATEHDVYDATGKLQTSDTTNADGSHEIYAGASGLTLTSNTGVADAFTSHGGDTFVFHAGFGQDTISKFAAGNAASHDTIQIDQSLVADFAHLSIAASGLNAVITVTPHDSITVLGVAAAALTAKDFAFS